eukprot:TRINITY_DN1892_c0_g1_i1.p1 TRINITY_DN1892_c0_g1~~TRINITY_DN1892_c0_g1_i1.p1  ORF type:complete len:601 (+),score=206.05 TRINITY_DN1892_c0_g1_i1:172-1803(+)
MIEQNFDIENEEIEKKNLRKNYIKVSKENEVLNEEITRLKNKLKDNLSLNSDEITSKMTIRNLYNENEALKDKIDVLNKTIESLQVFVKVQEQCIGNGAETSEILNKYRQKLLESMLRNKYFELETNKSLSYYKEQYEAIEIENQQYEQQFEILENKNKTLKIDISIMETKLMSYETLQKQLKTQLQSYEEYYETDRQVDELIVLKDNTIDDLKKQLNEYEVESFNLKKKLETFDRNFENLQKEDLKKTQLTEALEKKNIEYQHMLEIKERHIDKLEKDLSSNTDIVTEQKKIVNEQQRLLMQREEQLRKIENKFKTEIDRLKLDSELKVRDLEKEIMEVKKKLKDSEEINVQLKDVIEFFKKAKKNNMKTVSTQYSSDSDLKQKKIDEETNEFIASLTSSAKPKVQRSDSIDSGLKKPKSKENLQKVFEADNFSSGIDHNSMYYNQLNYDGNINADEKFMPPSRSKNRLIPVSNPIASMNLKSTQNSFFDCANFSNNGYQSSVYDFDSRKELFSKITKEEEEAVLLMNETNELLVKLDGLLV